MGMDEGFRGFWGDGRWCLGVEGARAGWRDVSCLKG